MTSLVGGAGHDTSLSEVDGLGVAEIPLSMRSGAEAPMLKAMIGDTSILEARYRTTRPPPAQTMTKVVIQ